MNLAFICKAKDLKKELKKNWKLANPKKSKK